MNLTAAIMLVDKNVRPVRVEYDPESKYNNNPMKHLAASPAAETGRLAHNPQRPTPMTPDLAELRRIAEAALRCLYLEAPESVVKDVSAKVEAVFAAQAARIEALEAGTRAIFDVAQGMNPDQSFNAEGRLRRCAEHAANLLGDRHD